MEEYKENILDSRNKIRKEWSGIEEILRETQNLICIELKLMFKYSWWKKLRLAKAINTKLNKNFVFKIMWNYIITSLLVLMEFIILLHLFF